MKIYMVSLFHRATIKKLLSQCTRQCDVNRHDHQRRTAEVKHRWTSLMVDAARTCHGFTLKSRTAFWLLWHCEAHTNYYLNVVRNKRSTIDVTCHCDKELYSVWESIDMDLNLTSSLLTHPATQWEQLSVSAVTKWPNCLYIQVH